MVDGQVLAVAGAKGGVGKTTTAINLGAALAERGFETAVVEFDLAMANLVDFLDLDVDPETDVTVHDVLAGDAELADATYTARDGLDVVPSGTTLAGYAGTDLDRLPVLVPHVRRRYDFVIFDTPAGASRELVEPLRLADGMLLVTTPRVSAIRNARNTLELAARLDVEARGLILAKSGTGASPGAEPIADFLDVDLLGHVPESSAVPHSQDNGSPVVTFAPESDAAAAYRDVARKLAPGGWRFAPRTDDPADPDELLEGRLGRSASDTWPDDADPSTETQPDRTSREGRPHRSTAEATPDRPAPAPVEDGGTTSATPESQPDEGDATAVEPSPAGGESEEAVNGDEATPADDHLEADRERHDGNRADEDGEDSDDDHADGNPEPPDDGPPAGDEDTDADDGQDPSDTDPPSIRASLDALLRSLRR